jgi:hypothetical protein
VAAEAGAEIVGGPSLKAVLDLNWDDPTERTMALGQVLRTLTTVEAWLEEQPVRSDHAPDPTPQVVAVSLKAAQQIGLRMSR